MSNVAATLMNYLVIIFSYLLGFKFPIEWLLTIIITVAPSSSAFSTPIEHRQPSKVFCLYSRSFYRPNHCND